MVKTNKDVMLGQAHTVHRILCLLLKKPRLPLSAGYFFNVLDASTNDIIWCVRFLNAWRFVKTERCTVNIATIQKSQKQTHDPIGTRIMQLLAERSPSGSVFISRAFNVSESTVVEALRGLETIGLVAVKQTQKEFISLAGGRRYLLICLLNMVVCMTIYKQKLPKRNKPEE